MDKVLKKISQANRIVIKVGTSTLTYSTGRLNIRLVEKLVKTIADLHNMGKEIILVTSGAVGVGMGKLGLAKKPRVIRERQAAAAVGQSELMCIYDKLFSDYSVGVAQILMTKDVVEIPERKKNAMNTFETLLSWNIIPIVNENDVISIDELEFGENGLSSTFGDNDTLSAVVTNLTNSELLVIFSDIDGVYDSNPKENKDAKLIEFISNIDAIQGVAGDSGTDLGTGGMKTKFAAARIVTSHGSNMIIANGSNPDLLYDLLEGKNIGTVFSHK